MFDPSEVERQVEEQRQAAGVPGLALAVVQGEQVLYASGFGTTSVEEGSLPVTPQTLFRIASTTKPLTGTAAMRLVEEGKLDLDCPLRAYVPWLTLGQEGMAEHITLRLLMSHRAGLPAEYQLSGSRDPQALEAYVRKEVPRLLPVAPPGRAWHYSNPGINLVGYIVEAVSDRYFAEAMQELVFEPLQMQRTTFDPTVAMTYPLAQSHQADSEGRLSVQRRFWDRVAGYPSGGAFSTVLDLANFAIIHLNQGRLRNKQILSPASVGEMHTVQSDLHTSTGSRYGLTFFVESYKGVNLVQHWGGVDSFSSRFVLVPEAGVAVIVLHNRMASAFDADGIVAGILDQLLDLPAG